MIFTTLEGQKNLPRYFSQVFTIAKRGENGRIDFILNDGRIFRAEGPNEGPTCEVQVHDHGVFARLLREGQLGFCDAYLEGQWSSPDLQAFMDYFHADLKIKPVKTLATITTLAMIFMVYGLMNQ